MATIYDVCGLKCDFMPEDRDEFFNRYAQRIVDDMDVKDLMAFAIDTIVNNFKEDYTLGEVISEAIMDYDVEDVHSFIPDDALLREVK